MRPRNPELLGSYKVPVEPQPSRSWQSVGRVVAVAVVCAGLAAIFVPLGLSVIAAQELPEQMEASDE